MPELEKNSVVTGVYFNKIDKKYYIFTYENNRVNLALYPKTNILELLEDESIPLWYLRHSLGVSGEEENLENVWVTSKENYSYSLERSEYLDQARIGKTGIKDLFYSGIKVRLEEDEYSHAVGPIHAGVIEPGHFRFVVKGEIIQSLNIRLGFQRRNLLHILKGKSPIQAIPYSDAITGDSSVAYSIAFSEIYEKASGIEVSDQTKLLKCILLELERVAIHIGDIGAVAGDIGYYPLLGLCATDRGIPLGVMEAITGSRFGKAAIYPGEVRLNRKLTKESLKTLVQNLENAFNRVESQFLRVRNNSTARERTHECGRLTQSMVKQNGFMGMVARCTKLDWDLRWNQDVYKGDHPLILDMSNEDLDGDVWSRWYLRYLELKNSVQWLRKKILEIDCSEIGKNPLRILDIKKFKEGFYYSAVEGWRGPVLVGFYLNDRGEILDSFIRDPSVPNWHALELAVRGELIGDFPLNNKSFNLSYTGFDL